MKLLSTLIIAFNFFALINRSLGNSGCPIINEAL